MKVVTLALCLLSLVVSSLSEPCVRQWSLYILIGAYVPRCNDDGTWKPLQTHGSTGLSWCVNATTGEILTEKVRGEIQC